MMRSEAVFRFFLPSMPSLARFFLGVSSRGDSGEESGICTAAGVATHA